MCIHCKRAGRIHFNDTADVEAACTFGPWLDNVLHERGLVVLRQDLKIPWSDGPFKKSLRFAEHYFPFSDADCHLVEIIDMDSALRGKTICRWERIGIGKRLWAAESINNQCFKLFSRVFTPGRAMFKPLSSPPTPPSTEDDELW